MSDPRSAEPDLCSIRTADGQEEPTETVCGFSADGLRPADYDPPAPPASGIDCAILRVPKTCATWAKGPAEHGRAFGMRRAGLGLARGGMIFGLWA